MNFRVFSSQRKTTDLTTVTSFQYYQMFTNVGIVSHLAFDLAGQSHIANASGHLSAITIDVTFNKVKLVDGMTVQHALAFADHFGGAVEYTDGTAADAAYVARFALPIGAIEVTSDDRLEVTISCSVDQHGAAATATQEVGVVNNYESMETGYVKYSRRDIPANASGKDDRTVADGGVVAVFVWDTASHISQISLPDTGQGFPSQGSPGIFKAAAYADARLSAYGAATFWNKMIRIWGGRGKGILDTLVPSITQDATGQNNPIYGVSMSVSTARAMASKMRAQARPARSQTAVRLAQVMKS